MSKINFKRLSQSLKRKSATLSANLDENLNIDNLTVKKKGTSLAINRKTISDAGDLYDAAEDCITNSEKGMVDNTRHTISDFSKLQISSANKILKEAGVPDSERKNIIKKIKEDFKKESDKLALKIKKKFGGLKKSVMMWKKGENSTEDKKDFSQAVKDNGQADKLGRDSDVKDCIETITEDLPEKVDENKKEVKVVLNKLNTEHIKLLEDTIARRATVQERSGQTKKLSKKILEEMYDKFESTLNKKLDAICEKSPKLNFKASSSGLTIGKTTCKNIKEVGKTCIKEFEKSKDTMTDIYKTTEQITSQFMESLREALQTDTNNKNKDQIDEDIEELFANSMNAISIGVASFTDQFKTPYNTAKNLFKDKNVLKKM